jgi:ribosomal protein L37E
MPIRSRTQRTLLLGFVASLAICGVTGIYCLLLGDIGKLEEKILWTTASFSVASILALAAAVPWERRRWMPVGPLAMVMILAALAFWLFEVWADFRYDADVFVKTIAITWIVAVALAHVGLISLARLSRQWRFVQPAVAILVAVLTTQISLMIIADNDDEPFVRLAGILAIAVACGSISLPILHRVSALRTREDVRTVDLRLAITCPRCGKAQTLPAGRSTCIGCALRFNIEIEEDTCRQCGYPLYKLESAVCPECGTPIAWPPRLDLEHS